MLSILHRQGGTRSARVLRAALMAVGVGLTASQAAHAAMPSANTPISTQASASYWDGAGQQVATSNTVVTTVSQVGAYTLSPALGQTKSAAAGATVYTPYVLTNTGNGTDSFTINASELAGGADFAKIEIYTDNGNGLPANTTPLCTQSTAGQSCATSATLDPGKDFKFVVAYSMPSTPTVAPYNWTDSGANTATVKAMPTSKTTTWYGTYSQPLDANGDRSESRTDTVNLTAAAAFTVTKAIAAPAVPAVSGGWPALSSGPRATTTTFTLTYRNSGGSPGTLYIKDVLPDGLTYVSGQSVISCAGGTALTEGSGGDNALCGNLGIEFEQSGQTIQAVIPNVAQGATGTLSFKVTVAQTAVVGSPLANTAKFTVAGATVAAGCSSATIAGCSSATLTTSNEASFTVTATRSVKFNEQDSTAGTPAGSSPATSTDAMTSLNIVPGGSVKQTHRITNTGNAIDKFNLSVAAGNFPTGTTFSWFAVDGSTALLDTNSDNIIDTGDIAAGAYKDVVLQITLPSNATPASPASLQATATVTSVYDSAIKDATYVNVTNVLGGYVDLTSTASGSATAGDIGPGPGQTAVFTTTAIVAGSAVHQIELWIKNYDSIDNTYNLDASSNSTFPGNLPAGWSVVFSSTACTSQTAITSVAVNAGVQTRVYACVTSSPTSQTVVQPIYFKVTSTIAASSGNIVYDVIYDAVSVVSSSAYAFSLASDGKGNVVKGGNFDYPHTLTNTGSNACGAGNKDVPVANNYIKVEATLPSAAATAGWRTALYLDNDGNGVVSDGDTLINDGKLVTGGLPAGSVATASKKFIVRVYAPGGANPNDTAIATVTVSDVDSTGTNVQSPPNGCGTAFVTDTSTVVAAGLKVDKKQAWKAPVNNACPGTYPLDGEFTNLTLTAAPGDCLYYDVTATNYGAVPLTNVSMSDQAPNATTLLTSPAIACSSSGLTQTSGTLNSAGSSGSGVSCSNSDVKGVNTLAPSGWIKMRFGVKVDK